MVSLSVKIDSVDESFSNLGGRVLRVRTSSVKSFKTPARPISTREVSAKSYL
jgi:hypothetical protein